MQEGTGRRRKNREKMWNTGRKTKHKEGNRMQEEIGRRKDREKRPLETE